MPALKAALPARYKAAARRAYLRLSSVLNAGSHVTCPVCEHTYRQFARFHGEHDQCPSCGSLMRHRALLLYLRDVLEMGKDERDIIHVGPGAAIEAWLAGKPNLRYLSVDLEPEVADMRADITDLPFDEASFDFALCVHVLEHVPDDRAAIAELYRVLRPGGTALIQVPPSDLAETREDFSVTDPGERERLFGQHDHVRLCGADYRLRLEAPGFRVDVEDYAERLGASERERYGLRVGEPFYLCVKPAPAE